MKPGLVGGECPDGSKWVVARQQLDGIYWNIDANNCLAHDEEEDGTLRKVVFHAYPALHLIGWEVDENTPTWKIAGKLRKQFRQLYHSGVARGLAPIIQKWKRNCDGNTWWNGVQDIEPKQVWNHDNLLTDYQVWVLFRVMTMQLDTFVPAKILIGSACWITDAENKSRIYFISCGIVGELRRYGVDSYNIG